MSATINPPLVTDIGPAKDLAAVEYEKMTLADVPSSSSPTISYTVTSSDTMTSIAARFDCTPSELSKLNRLSSRFLFPGQILMVPNRFEPKERGTTRETGQASALSAPDSDVLLSCHAPVKGDGKYPSIEQEEALDRDCLAKFLKIQVRHITDGQGVVTGILLVTPNAVMFDPNVSDPLVIERGSESYGVIAPMDLVGNIALYYDIAHMRVNNSIGNRAEIPRAEIYYSTSHEETISKFGAEPDLLCVEKKDRQGSQESPSKEMSLRDLPGLSQDTSQEDNESCCSCGGETRETSAFPKAFEYEIPPSSCQEESLLSLNEVDISPTNQTTPGDVTEAATSDGALAPGDNGSSISPFPGSYPESKSTQDQLDEKCLKLSSTFNDMPSLTKGSSSSHITSPQIPVSPQPSINNKKRTTSVTFNTSSESEMPVVPEDGTETYPQQTRKQKVMKHISNPLTWMENLAGSTDSSQQSVPVPASAPPVELSENEGRSGMFSNVFNISNVSNMITRRTSVDSIRRTSHGSGDSSMATQSNLTSESGTSIPALSLSSNDYLQKRAQYKEKSKFGLKSMVAMDDRPDLFAAFDKMIPKPASTCDDPPLYLCMRMGMPTNKLISRGTPIITYGKKIMKAEYWFSIPKPRVDELFDFFQIWSPELYGEVNVAALEQRKMLLIEDDVDVWPEIDNKEFDPDGKDGKTGELKEMTKESWEVVAMSDELRRALYSSNSLSSLDIEVFLPDVIGTSELINDAFRKNMYRRLPARVQGCSWRLVFSTAQHGFSLKSLYRKMADVDSPILLHIQDTYHKMFGAVLSCPLHVSDLFYGTGESFLFISEPEFKLFPWSGENAFFVKGSFEHLYIGGGDGQFGLWLDGDLYQGRSQSCKTFNNPQLSTEEDFIVKTLECWSFV